MAGRETSAEIDAEAADWAVRVDHAPLDPHDRARLESWLAGDSRRLGAYARASAVFVHAKRTRALDLDLDGHDVPDADEGAGPARRAAERPTRRRMLAWGGSAAVAGVAAMLGLSWQAAAQTYRTGKGEVRLVPLEDGSSITLDTASTVRVRYRSNAREVEVIEGEALFDVAHDSHRPFLVTAGDARIAALGTSFSVSILGTSTEVLVRRGLVEITRPSAPGAIAARVPANARAVATPATPIVEIPVSSSQIEQRLAWREGMLAFEGMRLADAAAAFARYSDIRIAFDDPTIGRETVVGLYAANDPRGFARAVALSLGLNATNAPDHVTLSRQR